MSLNMKRTPRGVEFEPIFLNKALYTNMIILVFKSLLIQLAGLVFLCVGHRVGLHNLEVSYSLKE